MTLSGSMHPSPHRERVGLVSLMAGLVMPPTAWAIQLLVDYSLTSYSCYPGAEPRNTVLPNWSGVWVEVLVLNLFCLLVAVAFTVLSYRNWQVTKAEHPGTSDDLLASGEGRSRFIGLAGTISGSGFVLAIIFDLVSILGVPLCGL